jgi:hypothetical protein
MMGRECHSSYLSADFILKNSWCCFMLNVTTRGSLFADKNPEICFLSNAPSTNVSNMNSVWRCWEYPISVDWRYT